jgi:hypothetical protein
MLPASSQPARSHLQLADGSGGVDTLDMARRAASVG